MVSIVYLFLVYPANEFRRNKNIPVGADINDPEENTVKYLIQFLHVLHPDCRFHGFFQHFSKDRNLWIKQEPDSRLFPDGQYRFDFVYLSKTDLTFSPGYIVSILLRCKFHFVFRTITCCFS
jgi:hypothetical protein